MSGTELAALIVAIASVVGVVLLAVALISIQRTLSTLRTAVDELRRETVPVITEMQHTVRQANAELERVDVLLGSAESISATVDSASHLAYLALSNPLIKAMAFAAGTSRATKALRRGR
jgi:uncharacterized protein YoxC